MVVEGDISWITIELLQGPSAGRPPPHCCWPAPTRAANTQLLGHTSPERATVLTPKISHLKKWLKINICPNLLEKCSVQQPVVVNRTEQFYIDIHFLTPNGLILSSKPCKLLTRSVGRHIFNDFDFDSGHIKSTPTSARTADSDRLRLWLRLRLHSTVHSPASDVILTNAMFGRSSPSTEKLSAHCTTDSLGEYHTHSRASPTLSVGVPLSPPSSSEAPVR